MFVNHYLALNPLRCRILSVLGLAVMLGPDAVTAVNQVGEDSVILVHLLQSLPVQGQP